MTSGLRIALVHPFPFSEVRRGGERYVWDLAAYLGGRGHRVDVLTGTVGRPASRTEGNVTFIAVAHRSARVLGPVHGTVEDTFAVSVLRRCLTNRYDVVHAFTPQAAIAARAAGRRVVYTSLGAPTRAWLGTQPRIAAPTFRAAVRSASAVTALSEWAAAQVQATAGRRPLVLAPGIDVDAFPAKTSVGSGPPRILFASDASVPAKRVDLVLEALDLLAARRPGVRLVLGGPGGPGLGLPAGGGLDAGSSRPWPSRGPVEVLGVGEPGDLPGRYRDATVAVLASAGEAFGLVLVESLASGTPVVCADAAGPREIVDDPGIGRRFRADDAGDLARALDEAIDLAADPGTSIRCAAHARRWSWTDTVGPAHEALYRQLRR